MLARKSGRPRKHESSAAKARDFRARHGFSRVTVDVPKRLVGELRAYAALLRTRESSRPAGTIRWSGDVAERGGLHVIASHDGERLQVSSMAYNRGLGLTLWTCTATVDRLDHQDNDASRTTQDRYFLLRADGNSPDHQLSQMLCELIARATAMLFVSRS